MFNNLIFSAIEISCACPVLPNNATPWQPSSIKLSACSIVFSTFKLKSSFNTEIEAAYIPLIFDVIVEYKLKIIVL